MAIPAHIAEVLACDEGIDQRGLREHLEEAGSGALPWFLAEEAVRNVLCEAIFDDSRRLALEVVEASVPDSVNYHAITQDGFEFGSILSVPGQVNEVESFPTDALMCIARSWCGDSRVVDATLGPQAIPSEILERVLLFWAPSRPERWERRNLTQALLALAGVRSNDQGLVAALPAWLASSRFELRVGTLASNTELMVGRLLQEVIRESRVRWRFISIYRIFEAAYLLGLREKLLREFLQKPSEVVSEVQDALKSELASFQGLVEQQGLSSRFDDIRRVIADNESNRFLYAIKKKKKGENLSASRQGVAWVYAMRCAVVHSGQHDIVFDRFEDAEEGLLVVLPLLERAVVELIGIDPL